MVVVFFILYNLLLVCVSTSSTNTTIDLKFDSHLIEPLTYAIVLPVLQTEILLNSAGYTTSDSFSFLTNETLADRKKRVTAATIIKLWTDLRTTEKSMQVLTTTMLKMAKENPDVNMTYSDIIAKLDETYVKDSNLGKKYEILKEETNRNLTTQRFLINATALSALTDDEKQAIFEAEFGPGLMLLQFTQELISNTNKNYLLVTEACFKLAKDEELFGKIQNIFDQVLKDTARIVLSENNTDHRNTLFKNLKQKIILDEDLKIALGKMKIVLPDEL